MAANLLDHKFIPLYFVNARKTPALQVKKHIVFLSMLNLTLLVQSNSNYNSYIVSNIDYLFMYLSNFSSWVNIYLIPMFFYVFSQ